MNCLKCGAETPEQQLFCQDCLLSMTNYPVRPDTPVQLPKRTEPSQIKKGKKEVSPEVQIQKLKGRLRRARRALLIVFLLFLAALAGLLMHILQIEGLPLK